MSTIKLFLAAGYTPDETVDILKVLDSANLGIKPLTPHEIKARDNTTRCIKTKMK